MTTQEKAIQIIDEIRFEAVANTVRSLRDRVYGDHVFTPEVLLRGFEHAQTSTPFSEIVIRLERELSGKIDTALPIGVWGDFERGGVVSFYPEGSSYFSPEFLAVTRDGRADVDRFNAR